MSVLLAVKVCHCLWLASTQTARGGSHKKAEWTHELAASLVERPKTGQEADDKTL